MQLPWTLLYNFAIRRRYGHTGIGGCAINSDAQYAEGENDDERNHDDDDDDASSRRLLKRDDTDSNECDESDEKGRPAKRRRTSTQVAYALTSPQRVHSMDLRSAVTQAPKQLQPIGVYYGSEPLVQPEDVNVNLHTCPSQEAEFFDAQSVISSSSEDSEFWDAQSSISLLYSSSLKANTSDEMDASRSESHNFTKMSNYSKAESDDTPDTLTTEASDGSVPGAVIIRACRPRPDPPARHSTELHGVIYPDSSTASTSSSSLAEEDSIKSVAAFPDDNTPAHFKARLSWMPTDNINRDPKAEKGVVTLMGLYHHHNKKDNNIDRVTRRGTRNATQYSTKSRGRRGSCTRSKLLTADHRSTTRIVPPIAIWDTIQIVRDLGYTVKLGDPPSPPQPYAKKKESGKPIVLSEQQEREWVHKNWSTQKGIPFLDDHGEQRGTISAREDRPAWLFIRCEAEPRQNGNWGAPTSGIDRLTRAATQIQQAFKDRATLIVLRHEKKIIRRAGWIPDNQDSNMEMGHGYRLEAETGSQYGSDIVTMFQLFKIDKMRRKKLVAKCLCSYSNPKMCVCGPTIEMFETAEAWQECGLGTALLDQMKAYFVEKFQTQTSFPILFNVYHPCTKVANQWFVDRGFAGVHGLGEELAMVLH